MRSKLKYIFAHDKNITSGSIPKNIIALAIPLMIGALLQTTQNLIDMFWVGRLGPHSITAVAMSSTIIMFVFTISLGISIGTLSLVAKNIGSQNSEGAGIVTSHSIFLGILVSLIVAAIGFYFSEKFLALLGADSYVIEIGTNYLRILSAGSVTMILLFIGNYALQGAGDVIHPMLFLIIANILNIILDPIFIFGLGVPRMGVSGAAIATILAQAAAMIMVLRLLTKKDGKMVLVYPKPKIRLGVIKEILQIGIPSSLQMFLRTAMYMAIISLVAAFGMKAVAAFGIVMRLQMIMIMPALALGGAAATFMGQNMGASKLDRARKSVWVATWFDFGIMFFLGIFFFNFSEPVISIFSKDALLIAMGSEYLRITAFFYCFVAFGIVLNRGLSGAGDTFVPMLINLISLWVYLVPAAYYFSKYTSLGVRGIWWAVATSYALNAVLTIFWFETGMWKRRI